MSRRLCLPICCALTVAFVAITFGSVSAESLSRTGKDFLSITTAVPGNGQYILTPSKFVYTLTVSYSLKTSKVGVLSMKVFRLPGGGRKEPLATSQKVQIIRGEGTATLQSTEIFVKPGAERAAGGRDRLMIFASMASAEGKELAFSSSENILTGELFAEYINTVGGKDNVQLLSVQPPPGTLLQAGVNSPFDIKIAYNVVCVAPAYVLLSFNTVNNVKNQVHLRVYYMSVPRGRGVLMARLPLITLPAAKRGDTIGINVTFFNSITDKALTTDLVWPYNLTR